MVLDGISLVDDPGKSTDISAGQIKKLLPLPDKKISCDSFLSAFSSVSLSKSLKMRYYI